MGSLSFRALHQLTSHLVWSPKACCGIARRVSAINSGLSLVLNHACSEQCPQIAYTVILKLELIQLIGKAFHNVISILNLLDILAYLSVEAAHGVMVVVSYFFNKLPYG